MSVNGNDEWMTMWTGACVLSLENHTAQRQKTRLLHCKALTYETLLVRAQGQEPETQHDNTSRFLFVRVQADSQRSFTFSRCTCKHTWTVVLWHDSNGLKNHEFLCGGQKCPANIFINVKTMLVNCLWNKHTNQTNTRWPTHQIRNGGKKSLK